MKSVGAEVCWRLREFNFMHEARELKRYWEVYGPSQWGFGVALDIVTLERRVAALERLVTGSDTPEKPVTESKKQLQGAPDSYAETDAKRGVFDTNHDAAPAAIARTDADRVRTDKADARPGDGTGDQTSPHGCIPQRQSPAGECGGGEPPGVPQPDNGLATGGRGQHTQEAHATPRECSEPVGYAVVLSNGSIYQRCDFEWEAKAIADALPVAEGVQATVAGLYLSRPEPLSGSGKSGDAEKPIVWAVVESGTGIPLSVHLGERYARDTHRLYASGATQVVPLYRQPHTTLTDAEREAITNARNWLERWQQTGGYHSAASDDAEALRGLLERHA